MGRYLFRRLSTPITRSNKARYNNLWPNFPSRPLFSSTTFPQRYLLLIHLYGLDWSYQKDQRVRSLDSAHQLASGAHILSAQVLLSFPITTINCQTISWIRFSSRTFDAVLGLKNRFVYLSLQHDRSQGIYVPAVLSSQNYVAHHHATSRTRF